MYSHPESFYIQDGVTKSGIFGTPILVDAATEAITYVAYAQINQDTLAINETLLIKKIEVTGNITSMSFAYGAWEDRTTLTYIGY